MSKHFLQALFLSVFLWGSSALALDNGVNIFQESRPAPERPFQDLIGKNHRFEEFRGKFVLAMFWSRNCGPCVAELKSLNTFARVVSSKGIQVLLISTDKEWISSAEQKRFLNRFGGVGLSAYAYMDIKGELASDFGIFTTPHTVLINNNGEEIGRIRGSARWDDPQVIKYIYMLKNKYGS